MREDILSRFALVEVNYMIRPVSMRVLPQDHFGFSCLKHLCQANYAAICCLRKWRSEGTNVMLTRIISVSGGVKGRSYLKQIQLVRTADEAYATQLSEGSWRERPSLWFQFSFTNHPYNKFSPPTQLRALLIYLVQSWNLLLYPPQVFLVEQICLLSNLAPPPTLSFTLSGPTFFLLALVLRWRFYMFLTWNACKYSYFMQVGFVCLIHCCSIARDDDVRTIGKLLPMGIPQDCNAYRRWVARDTFPRVLIHWLTSHCNKTMVNYSTKGSL